MGCAWQGRQHSHSQRMFQAALLFAQDRDKARTQRMLVCALCAVCCTDAAAARLKLMLPG